MKSSAALLGPSVWGYRVLWRAVQGGERGEGNGTVFSEKLVKNCVKSMGFYPQKGGGGSDRDQELQIQTSNPV